MKASSSLPLSYVVKMTQSSVEARVAGDELLGALHAYLRPSVGIAMHWTLCAWPILIQSAFSAASDAQWGYSGSRWQHEACVLQTLSAPCPWTFPVAWVCFLFLVCYIWKFRLHFIWRQEEGDCSFEVQEQKKGAPRMAPPKHTHSHNKEMLECTMAPFYHWHWKEKVDKTMNAI